MKHDDGAMRCIVAHGDILLAPAAGSSTRSASSCATLARIAPET
jgi:hypothetical protein